MGESNGKAGAHRICNAAGLVGGAACEGENGRTDRGAFFSHREKQNYRRELDAFLEARNLQLTPAVEISNTDFIIRQLKESGGISCLPFFAVEESLRKGELLVLDVEGMKMEMVQQIFYHKSKWKTREMGELIRQVRGNMEENPRKRG